MTECPDGKIWICVTVKEKLYAVIQHEMPGQEHDMKPKIFIDGEHGTTGLQIRSRMAGRADVELLSIPEAERRNAKIREDLLNAADIAILCLPDDASRQAVEMTAANNNVRIIDTSTAFRVHPDWAYGFAEMDGSQAARIKAARYVANPGCYPTGAIGLIRPLRMAGLLPENHSVTVNAIPAAASS